MEHQLQFEYIVKYSDWKICVRHVLSPIYESYLKDILGNQILTIGMIVRFCATLLHLLHSVTFVTFCYIVTLLHYFIVTFLHCSTGSGWEKGDKCVAQTHSGDAHAIHNCPICTLSRRGSCWVV